MFGMNQNTQPQRAYRPEVQHHVVNIENFARNVLLGSKDVITQLAVSGIRSSAELEGKFKEFIICAVNYYDYLMNEAFYQPNQAEIAMRELVERWVAYIIVNYPQYFQKSINISDNDYNTLNNISEQYKAIVNKLLNSNVMRQVMGQMSSFNNGYNNSGLFQSNNSFGGAGLSNRGNSFHGAGLGNTNTNTSIFGAQPQTQQSNLFGNQPTSKSNFVIEGVNVQAPKPSTPVQPQAKQQVSEKPMINQRNQFDIDGRKDCHNTYIVEAKIMNYEDHSTFPVFKPISNSVKPYFDKEAFLKLIERIPVDVQDTLDELTTNQKIIAIDADGHDELALENKLEIDPYANVARAIKEDKDTDCLGTAFHLSNVVLSKESYETILEHLINNPEPSHRDIVTTLTVMLDTVEYDDVAELINRLNTYLLRFINLSLDTPLVTFNYLTEAEELTGYYINQENNSTSEMKEKYLRCASVWSKLVPSVIRDYFLFPSLVIAEVVGEDEESNKEEKAYSVSTVINYMFTNMSASRLPIFTTTSPGRFSYVRKTSSPALYSFFDKVYRNTKMRNIVVTNDGRIIEIYKDLINKDVYYFGEVEN